MNSVGKHLGFGEIAHRSTNDCQWKAKEIKERNTHRVCSKLVEKIHGELTNSFLLVEEAKAEWEETSTRRR